MMIALTINPAFTLPSSVSATSAMPGSPVGLESTELHASTLKPLEQPSTLASTNHTARQQHDIDVREEKSQKEIIHNRAEQAIIQKLAKLDREVRNHERAHASVGGQYAGSPTYEYQRGPDGVYYAVAGQVSIDTSPVAGDPRATIEKAQTIRRAALAPAEPSSQDRIVAAEATKMEMTARGELNKEVAEMKSEQGHTEKHDDDAVDALNQVQEQAFKDISSEMTEQLIAFNSANIRPKTLGHIVNHII